jgi:hypothetical protein
VPWWVGRHVYAVYGATGLIALGGLLLEYGDEDTGFVLIVIAAVFIVPAAVWWYLSNRWIARNMGGPDR